MALDRKRLFAVLASAVFACLPALAGELVTDLPPTQAIPPYSCSSPHVERLRVNGEFFARVEHLKAIKEIGRRAGLVQELTRIAHNAYEEGFAQILLGDLYVSQGRVDEANAVFWSIAGSSLLHRHQKDFVRLSLAELASQKNDIDGILSWLEPMVTANCSYLPDKVPALLAYAYQEKGRLADALREARRVRPHNDAGQERWSAVRIDLGCRVEGARECLEYIAKLALKGGLTGDALVVAQRQVGLLQSDAVGKEVLAQWKAEGLLNEANKIRVQPKPELRELVPIRAVSPQYPRDAEREGIVGWVDVEISVNSDGTVKDVKAVAASPEGYFEKSALAAARKSTFEPRLVNGRPVEAAGLRRYNFMLNFGY